MIGFQHPWLLLGLLAALWPLWLHLRGRRRAPTVAFSALIFLHGQQPRRARAQRLRERALLAARVLLAGGVAVALAGPLVPSCDEQATPLADRPLALVVVVDDSLSMTARAADGSSRFERARRRAATLLDRLPRHSRAMVVLASRPAQALLPRLDGDIDSLRADVQGLLPRGGSDDAVAALQLAGRLLAHADERDRRVVVVSDLQADGWNDWPRPALAALRVEVEAIVDEVENTAIIAADAVPAPERGAHQVRLTVEVSHHGKHPFVGALTVQVGGREVRRQIEVAPGASRRVELPLQAVEPLALVALPGSDAIAGDDRRLVSLGGGAALRVALVNGAPRPVEREDEVHFLRQALETAGGAEIETATLQPAELSAERLEGFDVVWLANVGELSLATVEALRRRLEAGLGVVVSAGDESASAVTTGWLAALLPGRLGGPQAGPSLPGVRLEDGEEAATIDAAARALRRALHGQEVGLRDLQVRRRLAVQPGPKVDMNVAMRHADGAPAALAFSLGRGRVVVWTGSIDLDWGDLPLQPGMLPLVLALAQQAQAGPGGRPRGDLTPGQAFELPLTADAERLEISDERGALVSQQVRPTGATRWRVAGLPAPGRYRPIARSAAGSAVPLPDLIVVPPGAESDLSARATPPPLGISGADAAGAARRVPRSPIAPIALATLLLLLIVEAALLLDERRQAPREAA